VRLTGNSIVLLWSSPIMHLLEMCPLVILPTTLIKFQLARVTFGVSEQVASDQPIIWSSPGLRMRLLLEPLYPQFHLLPAGLPWIPWVFRGQLRLTQFSTRYWSVLLSLAPSTCEWHAHKRRVPQPSRLGPQIPLFLTGRCVSVPVWREPFCNRCRFFVECASLVSVLV